MKIKSVSVTNYRSLKQTEIPIDNLTVLLGQNGCGKSCFLGALRLFYETDIHVGKEDFYAHDTANEITVTVCFSDLTQAEKDLFASYLEGDQLSVEKVISYAESKLMQKYYGKRHISPDFEPFRKASGAANLKGEYEKLRLITDYKAFPAYKNKDEANAALEKWELEHKDKCVKKRDDGQSFCFRSVGTHRLEKHTKFIFVPAVQEASDESSEQKGSMFEEIMQLVVKGATASAEVTKLQEDTERKYKELIDPTKNTNLMQLEQKLTGTLNYFVPDSAVKIDWINQTAIQITPPRAFVQLREGGYVNTVDRCGHGLQRAYILSLFQQLAIIQASNYAQPTTEGAEKTSLPNLIIGIEEPELYQHPDRQRHFCQTLMQLSSKGLDGVTNAIQIVYSTHSPLMVDFQRFNQLRIFGKVPAAETGKPKVTKVTYSTLTENARFLEQAKTLPTNDIQDEALRQRLIHIMTPWMNEGFFAKMVVLVEGIKDRALIMGQALSQQLDLEGLGISVIPCSGKMSLPEVISIFKSLRIPMFVVWDSDVGKANGINTNRAILKCLGVVPENYPCMMTDDFCCTKTNLEKTFQVEIGENPYQQTISRYCEEHQLGDSQYSMENHFTVQKFIDLFKADGHESATLKEIVTRIMKKYQIL